MKRTFSRSPPYVDYFLLVISLSLKDIFFLKYCKDVVLPVASYGTLTSFRLEEEITLSDLSESK